MVESNSQFANGGHNDALSSFSSLRREPSFSGWCDSKQTQAHRDSLKNAKSNLERENQEGEKAGEGAFELPFLAQNHNQYQTQNQQVVLFGYRLRMDNASANLKENDNIPRKGDNYLPLNVDDSSKGEPKPILNSKSVVSAADVVKTLILILVWYTFSLFLTMYNKSLLGDHMGRFPAPFLMNTIHFALQASLAKAITWICWGKRHEGDSMTWGDYFSKVVPTALATALDINLSNISLIFISVTFATMCKSASPIFLLLFAFAFRLETPSLKLFGIILVISVGFLLTVAKDTEFEIWGFLFVMLAAVMSGFRWCMTQILLQREAYGLKNPLVFMSYVTPVMAIATAVLSLLLDPWRKLPGNQYFNSSWHVTKTCLLMLFGGSLAFFMVLTEFILISVTSAVTVTIAGIVKEAVTIIVAVFYFHDDFTWLKGIGLVIIMVGVNLFNWYKYQKLQEGESARIAGEGSAATEVPGKYVILEETDDKDSED